MYQLKLWNGKYGDNAQFVAFDTKNKKYTEFSVKNPQDVAWVNQDITKNPEYENWEYFGDEPVNFLEDVMM